MKNYVKGTFYQHKLLELQIFNSIDLCSSYLITNSMLRKIDNEEVYYRKPNILLYKNVYFPFGYLTSQIWLIAYVLFKIYCTNCIEVLIVKFHIHLRQFSYLYSSQSIIDFRRIFLINITRSNDGVSVVAWQTFSFAMISFRCIQ